MITSKIFGMLTILEAKRKWQSCERRADLYTLPLFWACIDVPHTHLRAHVRVVQECYKSGTRLWIRGCVYPFRHTLRTQFRFSVLGLWHNNVRQHSDWDGSASGTWFLSLWCYIGVEVIFVYFVPRCRRSHLPTSLFCVDSSPAHSPRSSALADANQGGTHHLQRKQRWNTYS
jgi:hypothetical protein